MSEIKVNKISPRSGTAVTLGDSGDKFTVPSGSNITINSGASITNDGTATGFDTDTNDKVKVSANDTTPGFLNGKLVAGTNITLTEGSDGGNETLTAALSGTITPSDNTVTLAKMAPGTDGNIISYDASGNPVAVATGNAGQILTSAGAGAVPSFQAAPAAGLNVITSSDISDNTSLLNNDGNFSSTYDLYYVNMSKVKVSGNTSLFLRFNQSGSALTASYTFAVLGLDGSGNARSASSNSTAYISFTSNAMIAGSATHNLSFFITDPLNAIGTYYKVAYGQYGGFTDQASNSALVGTWSGGYYGNTSALSGFQIGTTNSATFDTGNITLYGVKTT